MFTVLVRHKETRRECLFEAISVEMAGPSEEEPGLLINFGESQTHLAASGDRDVFVMNRQGSTVARYAL